MSDENVWLEFLSRQSSPIKFTDYGGEIRVFELSRYSTAGYTILAKEVGSTTAGYEFEATSYSSPQEAMNKLVEKIRMALATRCMDPNNFPSLLASRCFGRVDDGGVVIDGEFVSWDKFVEMVQSHEGWEFELKFGDT